MNAATTQDQRVDELRHSGVRLAMSCLIDGDNPLLAYNAVVLSVQQQARVAGIAGADVDQHGYLIACRWGA